MFLFFDKIKKKFSFNIFLMEALYLDVNKF